VAGGLFYEPLAISHSPQLNLGVKRCYGYFGKIFKRWLWIGGAKTGRHPQAGAGNEGFSGVGGW